MSVGKIVKENNNNWIVLEKNNIKKRYILGKYKKYYTMNNGGHKYKIIISDKNIYVFSNEPEYDMLCYEIKKYQNIFIGKNTKKYSIFSGLYTGSSILVEIKKNVYIFIGDNIIQFNTKEPVVEFHSIMGNSSVVYPFALTENYSILLVENVYLKREETDKDKDPYEIYYDFKSIYKRKSYNLKIKTFN